MRPTRERLQQTERDPGSSVVNLRRPENTLIYVKDMVTKYKEDQVVTKQEGVVTKRKASQNLLE